MNFKMKTKIFNLNFLLFALLLDLQKVTLTYNTYFFGSSFFQIYFNLNKYIG